jgi:hypothetical protein
LGKRNRTASASGRSGGSKVVPIDDHLTASRNYSDEGSRSFAAIKEV